MHGATRPNLHLYNPSIQPYRPEGTGHNTVRWIAAVRHTNHHNCNSSRTPVPADLEEQTAIVLMDESFAVTQSVIKNFGVIGAKDKYNSQFTQDCRIFNLGSSAKSRLWLSCFRQKHTYMSELRVHLGQDGTISVGSFSFIGPVGVDFRARGTRSPVDKNLQYFLHQGSVWLQFRINPHSVCRLDMKTGRCANTASMYETKIDVPNNVWNHDVLRGNACCLHVESSNIFLGVGHFKSGGYQHMFFAFEASPPFKIVWVGEPW